MTKGNNNNNTIIPHQLTQYLLIWSPSEILLKQIT